MRNLASGEQDHVEALLTWATVEALFESLRTALEGSSADEVVRQALYTVCNLATGSEAHKAGVMSIAPEIAFRLVECLSHASSEVRLAAIWCVINLTWPQDEGALGRVEALEALGCEVKLKGLLGDPVVNIEGRITYALPRRSRCSGSASGSALALGTWGTLGCLATPAAARGTQPPWPALF